MQQLLLKCAGCDVCEGAIAGAVTGVVTTPLDVIKTRLMTQGSNKTYSGVLDCAHKIWTQEGSAAFLKVSKDPVFHCGDLAFTGACRGILAIWQSGREDASII